MSAEELMEYLKRQLAELGFIKFFKNNNFVPTLTKLLNNIFHLFMNSKLGPIYHHSRADTDSQRRAIPAPKSLLELETTEGNPAPQTP